MCSFKCVFILWFYFFSCLFSFSFYYVFCVRFHNKYRSTQSARLLQGKALEVYQRLTDEEVDDYEVLKVQLLKRFRLTEGGYRKKFKMIKLEPGESPEQFVERLRRYLEKWRVMAGYEARYDRLEDMILRNQYFLTFLYNFLERERQVELKKDDKSF